MPNHGHTPSAGADTPLKRGFKQTLLCRTAGTGNWSNSPLKRGETGVCQFFAFIAVTESRGLYISQWLSYIGKDLKNPWCPGVFVVKKERLSKCER